MSVRGEVIIDPVRPAASAALSAEIDIYFRSLLSILSAKYINYDDASLRLRWRNKNNRTGKQPFRPSDKPTNNCLVEWPVAPSVDRCGTTA
ncbi:Transcription initiation factor TFIID subunit [Trichinella pseudospiralis]